MRNLSLPLTISYLALAVSSITQASTVSVDFESSNPLTGGTGTITRPNGTTALAIGGQNDPRAIGDFSGSLPFLSSGDTVQQYSVRFEIGIENPGSGSSSGFQISNDGTLNNGTGPHFQFINGGSGLFTFSTGQGGEEITLDDNGNSWSYTGDTPQAGEIFTFDFLVGFYTPTGEPSNSNNRTFDFSATASRSDPGNTVANDSLTFTASKTVSGTNFVDTLGDIVFQGSGTGGFQGSIDNILLSNVPEPSASILCLLGISATALRRKRA